MRIKDKKKSPDTNTIMTREKGFITDLFISGINTPACVQLLIIKPEFKLGKSDACDGVLAFSDEISREHCKILWREGQYYVIDLNSTNGTFLNDDMLAPNHEYPIKPGDRLKLSSVSFTVEQIFSMSNR